MKKLTLMMGGPASGKSHVRAAMFPEQKVIDCDELKKLHPEYDESAPTTEVHAWSSLLATKQVNEALENGESFVFDGTGSTAEKYVGMIKKAHKEGYETEVVYVVCDLQTALERNQNRVRVVPENVVREKHAQIADSFEIVSRYASSVQVVNNQ